MGSDRGIQVHKAHRSPNQLNLKKSFSSHIILKLSKIKNKERILKSARIKKIVTYKGTPISVDLLAETLQTRMREWDNIFKVLKVKNRQPRIFYLAVNKLSQMNKILEVIHHPRPSLQEMQKTIFKLK